MMVNQIDSESLIKILEDLPIINIHNLLSSIVSATYPSILDHLDDLNYLQERSFHAPIHDIIEEINNHIISLIPNELKTYLSCDSPCKKELIVTVNVICICQNFFNTSKCLGLLNHKWKLKVGIFYNAY